MSIQNRKLKAPGTYPVTTTETNRSIFLAKIVCLFKGHKPAQIVTSNNTTFNYCLCCWKELDKD